MPKRDKHIKELTLKNGEKRYKFNTYIGLDPVTGKRVFSNGTFDNYNDAKDAYDKVRLEGVTHYSRPKQKTVDEVYRMWFDVYKNETKESTANKININYNVHIKPWFGDDYIDQISSEKFQQFANKKSQELVKYREIINRFNQIYKYAAAMRFCKREDNPVNMIIIPKRTTRKRRDIKNNFYTLSELKEFLEAAENHDFRSYTYFLLLATTGLRKSEALALLWSDFDLKNKTVRVSKTLSTGLNNRIVVQSPKSEDSKRMAVLTDHMIGVLKEYRKRDKLMCPVVFHKQSGEYLNISRPQMWLTSIYKANQQIKKHITVHGFRHTYATLNKEENMTDVQAVMGHADISMTEHYTHSTEEGRMRVRNYMNNLGL